MASSSSFRRFAQSCSSIKTSSSTTDVCRSIIQHRFFAYAAVNHAQEYKDQIDGRHGQQLQLAIREGLEKRDGSHFNPFEAYAIPNSADSGTEADETDVEKEDLDEGEVNIGDSDQEEEAEEEEELAIPTKEGLLPEVESIFTNDGSLPLKPSERHAFRAGLAAGGEFAIINIGGSQHKVTVDDVVILNKLRPVDHWSVGSTHILKDNEILLMGSQNKTLVGLPYVKGGEVEVMVEEITRDKTVIVFKKRRRKNSRRKNGFRREVTFLRILGIRFPETQAVQDNKQEPAALAECPERSFFPG